MQFAASFFNYKKWSHLCCYVLLKLILQSIEVDDFGKIQHIWGRICDKMCQHFPLYTDFPAWIAYSGIPSPH